MTKALEHAKEIKAIVYNDDAPQPINLKHVDELKEKHPSVPLISFSNFLTSAEGGADPVPPSSNDIACIMYTSGSSGAPKGVLLKHRNIVAAAAGINSIVGQHMVPGERLLTYLPLAHIVEFVVENVALYWGAILGYGNPRTLSDQSVRNSLGDIRAFKPSIMVGVPAIWESIKKGIINRVGASGLLKSNIFWGAMAVKQRLLYWGFPGAKVLDRLVFSNIKEATGGNLRLVLNGAGPIAEETRRFISFAICPMIIGYGLTETAG